MANHKVVSREEWLEARQEHLKKEKEFTRLRDEVSRHRRDMPWVKLDKEYLFDTERGKQSLADLFEDCSQLITYHFMFHPDWEQGCKSCSFLADSYAGSAAHLKARNVSLVTVSKASLDQINTFRTRMGWDFPWVSSGPSDFNRDFHVSFTEEELENASAYYNYRKMGFPEVEAPGISVFFKDDDGTVYHTYSSYGRGLDMFITTYHLLDIVAKGRDEQDLPYSMAWIRHHDKYNDPNDSGSFH